MRTNNEHRPQGRFERNNNRGDNNRRNGFSRFSRTLDRNGENTERNNHFRRNETQNSETTAGEFRPRRFEGQRDTTFHAQRPRFGNDERRENTRFNGEGRRENTHYNSEQRPRFQHPTREFNRNYERPQRQHDADYDENSKYSLKKQIAHKKQFVDYNAPVRLNKFLANAGICSRREADEFITAGVVSVNGEIVTELGTKVVPATDKVLFHDQLVRSEKRVYILLNKPKDCVTTSDDPHARLTVLDLVKNACSERVYPVGRLDRNTTGVLLITNDGDLTSKMTHPKYNQKKIYEAVLDHAISAEDMQKLTAGIELEDGEIHVDNIEYSDEADQRKVGVEIHSGRNRIVRRMFDALGYKVLRLDRVYFAGLTKKNLPRGKWRFLSEQEINILKMSK